MKMQQLVQKVKNIHLKSLPGLFTSGGGCGCEAKTMKMNHENISIFL